MGLFNSVAATDCSTEKKRVVVVGGGIGGSLVAYSLQFCSNLVLIDQKEYLEIPWASLRAMLEPAFGERSLIRHSDYLTNAQIVTSAAAKITDTEVVTGEGSSFAYDYLVVAIGHMHSAPKTRSERLSEYHAEYEKIKASNSILIVGGGPTGVELAGEIVFSFPRKKVTLVHRGSRLLEFIGSKAARKALDWLTSKKVEVILDQSVDVNCQSDGVYQTSRGETIKADCHFECTGVNDTCSSWLKETALKDSLDIQGRLMVDEHLRVRGRPNVFAIGDITHIPELKQGYVAQRHALVAAKNLKLLMDGKESNFAKHKPGSAIAVVSLGRKAFVAQFPFITMTGCIPGMTKSGDLFVGKTRKQIGLKPLYNTKN